MKKIILLLASVIAICVVTTAQNPILTNYSYHFKIKGLKDTSVYMGFHYGDKKYIRDTAWVDSKGEVEFKGKDTIEGGIYLFILPNLNWFEFVVNEPSFKIETDTSDLIGKMKIKGSSENQLWYHYLNYIHLHQKDSNSATTIKKYRNQIIEQHPASFVASIMKALTDIDIPDAPKNLDGSIDSTFAYRYFRKHYFDHIDLADNRILRTPIFEQKFNYYFDHLIPQNPDSIIPEADLVLTKAKTDPEMSKFITQTLIYKYVNSKIICMDAVFVHLVDDYCGAGLCNWMPKKNLDEIVDRANKLRPILCNQQVTNIILPDTSGTWRELYDLKGDITILYFWESTCGHCKKATPQLKELYQTYLQPNGIEVFAIEGLLEDGEWIKYLDEHQLPWINVSDNPEINQHPEKYLKVTNLNSLNFRYHFDLTSYPAIFVLNKEKKIIAKKIGVESIKDFIENYRKMQAKN